MKNESRTPMSMFAPRIGAGPVTAAIPALMLLAGCPAQPVDPPYPLIIEPNQTALDPLGDEDGDGLLNGQEETGYLVYANVSGWPADDTEWRAYSDPYRIDSDEDGLDDATERLYGTDASRTDTDGDGLSDHDEAVYWATSPTHVDTDGDALVPDDAPQSMSAPPFPGMFDGAELDLRFDGADLDGAPQGYPGPLATSPIHADTDGDGVGDLIELFLGSRSPTVADVAHVSLSATPNVPLELAINTVDTFQNEDTTTFSQAYDYSAGNETTQSFSASFSVYADFEIDTWVAGSATAGCCSDIIKGDGEFGTKWQATLRYEQSVSFGFTQNTSRELTEMKGRAEAEAESETVEMSGGRVAVSVNVRNTGPVTFEVADVALAMRYRSPNGLQTLGELARGDTLTRCPSRVDEKACEVASTSVLAPGESIDLIFGDNDLPLEPMLQIVGRPDLLLVDVARFDLRDADGRDLDFVYDNLRSRTAVFNLNTQDFSGQYYVAADVNTLADGTQLGVSVAHALTQIGIDYTRPEAGDDVVVIDGFAGLEHVGAPPDLQANDADPLGYAYAGDPGERTLRRGWAAFIERADPDVDYEFSTDFFAARVLPGDVLEILLVEDADRDGLVNIEERLARSQDGKIHSDGNVQNPLGDGLSDYFEVREGWIVETVDRIPYRAFPSPAEIDTDGDGLTDWEEMPYDGGPGTDPVLADTDGDGYTDLEEVLYGNGNFLPLRIERRSTPQVQCTWNALGAGQRQYTVRIIDDFGDVEGFEIVPSAIDAPVPFAITNPVDIGVLLDTLEVVDVAHTSPDTVSEGFLRVKDSMQDQVEVSCTNG